MNVIKKISYIIITCNSSDYIEKCLSSIISLQSYIQRIIIVDNGSTDNTVNIIKSFGNTLRTKIRVTELSENVGVTKSRNIAAKQIDSDTDYVCVIDSDTFINQSAMNTLIEDMENNDNIGIIAPCLCYRNGDRQLSARYLPTVISKFGKIIPKYKYEIEKLEAPEFTDKLTDVGYLISAFWLIDYKIFLKLGLFDEKYFVGGNDLDYCARCHIEGYRVIIDNTVSITHVYQRNSYNNKILSKFNIMHTKALIRYFCKYRKNNIIKSYKISFNLPK